MSNLKNQEAEKAIIHILFHNIKSIGAIDEVYISPLDFTKRAYSNLYQILKQLYFQDARVELSSIISKAKELKFAFIENSKNVTAIENMLRANMSNDNLIMYCKIVRNLSIRNMLLNILDQAKGKVFESDTAQEAIDSVENIIYDFSNESIGNEEELIQLSREIESTLSDMMENPTIGLTTGLPTYDRIIGNGLRPGTINIIGARPKVGKSLISLSIALHNAKLGIPVLYMDTELSKSYQIMRLIGELTGIPFQHLESGKWQRIKAEVAKYKQAREYIDNLPLWWINIAGKSIEEIIGYIRRFVNKIVQTNNAGKYNPCLICYDYLKLMNASDRGYDMKEYEALGYRISHLHDLMVKYQSTMLMAVQLNRDGIDREDSITVSGSDRIIWLCDSFTIFKPLTRDEMSLAKDGGTHKLITSDTRYGVGNGDRDYVSLYVDKTCGQFRDLGLIKLLANNNEHNDNNN